MSAMFLPIKKAVIPAAGFGTRLLPATKSMPKELITVVDKPVIQYVVEEAAASGIEEVILVIAEGKELLREHFECDAKLETFLKQKGKHNELDSIIKLNEIARVKVVYQPEQKGLGDAVLCAENLVGKAPFALLLGDTIIRSNPPLTQQLNDVYIKHGGSVVALQQIDIALAHRYGIFDGDALAQRLFQAKKLVEKPSAENTPSNMAFAGRYVLTPEIFDAIRQTKPGVNNEIQLTDAINLLLAANQNVFGWLFEGKRYDVGNKLDFIKTNVELGLMRPDIAYELKAWLKAINQTL